MSSFNGRTLHDSARGSHSKNKYHLVVVGFF